MSQKMGFLAIASIVIGSQVGVGVLALPTYLAAYGSIGTIGWLASAGGAILLALVFAQLSSHLPHSGGPHVYIEAAFGKEAGFFAGWGYWLIAWTSNIAVIIGAVSYLTPVLGQMSIMHNLIFEILIVVVLTLLNICGASLAGRVEIVLTIIKCLPLIIIPIGGLIYFNIDNFYPINSQNLPIGTVTNETALIAFWGFIGLESATTNSGVVENPRQTIPRAVLFGTIVVVFLYILNCIGVMSLVPQDVLIKSHAPYVEAAQKIFGDNVEYYASIIIFMACIGTLNAWILTSGQIALGASNSRLFPACFGKVNKYGAPYISLLIAMFGTIIMLLTTLSDDLIAQIKFIIDIAVTAFLYMYLACMLAFLKLFGKDQPYYALISLLGSIFCLWIIISSPLLNSIVSLVLVLTGLPVYLWHNRK